jgi:phosphoglycolate phosphatase-like HAD superfamily hydrolase
LAELRREDGFNDDWVASRELLRRRGFDISLAEIARDGESFYLSIAKDNEELLLPLSLLRQLRKRHPLFIVTGRTRAEYAPIWGERFDPLFERVYCVDDVPGCRAKPHPDYLLQVLKDSGITSGAYIGNAVDDMQAACAAGLTAIGVAEVLVGKPSTAGAAAGADLREPSTAGAAAGADLREPTTTGAENFDEKESETSSSASEQHCQRTALKRAGAHAIISNCTELEELLMVSSAPQSSET